MKLAEKEREERDIEQAWAHGIHKIEREFGILITEDFPLMKFFNILDFCEYCQEEKEQMEEEYRLK